MSKTLERNEAREDLRRDDARENDEKLTDYFLIPKEKLMYASWNQIETWPEQKRLTPTHATMNTISFRNTISRVPEIFVLSMFGLLAHAFLTHALLSARPFKRTPFKRTFQLIFRRILENFLTLFATFSFVMRQSFSIKNWKGQDMFFYVRYQRKNIWNAFLSKNHVSASGG